MSNWFAQNWYIVTGLAGAAAYFAFIRYVHRNPDGLAMSLSQRFSYTWTAFVVLVAIGGLSVGILSVVFPSVGVLFDLLFTPYPLLLFPVLLWAAPWLQRWLPDGQTGLLQRLVARSLSRREAIGWLLFVVVVLAVFLANTIDG